MGVELPLRVVVTILECCVTFSGVKLSIRSFVLFWGPSETHQPISHILQWTVLRLVGLINLQYRTPVAVILKVSAYVEETKI